MPTYRYQCEECKEIKEVFHSISEEYSDKCCSKKMKKLISSGAGYLLKGQGLYELDYKRKDS